MALSGSLPPTPGKYWLRGEGPRPFFPYLPPKEEQESYFLCCSFNWWYDAPGGRGLKMRQIEVSCSSQLYSEHRTIYALSIKESHLGEACNHKDKLHMVKAIFFFIELHKQITITSCDA